MGEQDDLLTLPPEIQQLLDAMPQEEADRYLSKILEVSIVFPAGCTAGMPSACLQEGCSDNAADATAALSVPLIFV